MADITWLGRANKVADLWTLTVTGPVLVGETWTVTINGKDITFTATGTTTGNVVAGLVALLNAATAPTEFSDLTWADADPDITGTADTTGVPIAVTVTTDSATGTFVAVNTTPATGPEFVGNTANWSGGALPVSTDNVYFTAAEYGPRYALTALAAVTPTLIDVDSLATYAFGLPRINAAGYTEYRNRDLQFAGATTFRIRSGEGAGSGLMRFDFNAAVVNAQVESTGATTETGAPALNILGSHADNTLDMQSGSVGICFFGDETATMKTITKSGGSLVAGPGATLDGAGSAATIDGGTFTSFANVLTVTVDPNGTFTLEGSATCTTLTVQPGSTCNYNSSGTCTTANVFGTLDCTADRSPRTFTTINLERGGVLRGVTSMTISTLSEGAEVVTLTAA